MKKQKKEVLKSNKKSKGILKWIILLLILFITIYLAYTGYLKSLVERMGKYGLVGVFFTGVFWGYSFAAVPATALFVYFTKMYNPWIVALIGSLGVVMENTLVFIFFEKELPEEVKKKVDHIVFNKLKLKGKDWLIIISALIVMVTPIPNEIGIYLLTIARFNEKMFMIVSFLSSFMGILIIAGLGTLI